LFTSRVSQQKAIHSRNSYDFVRFCAATMVIFSHHFDLAGFAEPKVPLYGEDFGQLAVAIFFCLSGFLIAQSLEKNDDAARFLAARFLRIFPNLAFVLIVTSGVALIAYGNYGHFWQHIVYVFRNLTMFIGGTVFVIPGVLADATRQSLNDPLWTLPYELWLYVALFMVCLPGMRWGRLGILLLGTGLALLRLTDADKTAIGPLETGDLINLGSYFFAGAMLSLGWRYCERHSVAVGLAGLVALLIVVWNELTMLQPIALAACVLGLGSSRAMGWFARGGDASYGMYVFGWPLQQLSLHLIGPFWWSFALAFGVTVAIGYATWHGFERRALSYRDRAAGAIRRILRAARILSRSPKLNHWVSREGADRGVYAEGVAADEIAAGDTRYTTGD
jgi:peptidoglycan/LPS O-acetylase OafA/YrhL